MNTATAILGMLWLGTGAFAAVSASDMPDGTVDTSRWACALCPYRCGWTGEIDVGAGWVSESSNRFGDYRGLNEQGAFFALDGYARYRDEYGRYADIHARNLGIDSRAVEARSGVRGQYDFMFRSRQIPKYRGFGTDTPYLGVGGADLTLPPGWQPAPTTGAMSALATSLQPLDLETMRKMIDVGFRFMAGPALSYDIQYQHQDKTGTRPFGAGVFTLNSSHIPAPVDFSTDRLEVGVNYSARRSHWRLGFSGSEFSNGYDALTWENPFTPEPGTDVLRVALEPDNQYYRVDLAGAWNPSPGIRLSGNAAIGRMEQDEALLPYSINPAFSALPRPRLTADSRVDVGTVDLGGRLSARLTRRLDLTARFDRDERDNKTPVDTWTPVITDFLERDPRPNRPYGFERDRASLSLRYRAPGGVRLESGYGWEQYERSLQSVAETDEGGWFVQASFSPLNTVELRARLEHADRDGDPYLEVPDFSLREHPLMRKFNLASRDRRRLRLDLDYFPVPELTVNLAYRFSEDDYDDSFLGLRESEDRSLSLDAGWSPGEAWTAHLFASLDEIDSTLAGAEELSLTPWISTTADRFFTYGIGLTTQLSPKASLGLEFVSSEADGDIQTDTGAGEPPFPTLITDLRNLRLRFELTATDRWGVLIMAEHEHYRSSDWALDGIGPDGIPNILAFGAESPDYDVTVIRLQARCRF